MIERKEGWYWVNFCGITECARFSEYGWYVAGMEGTVPESCFTSISYRIPTPDEMGGWQVVPNKLTSEMESILYDWSSEPDYAWLHILKSAPKPGDV